MSARLFLGRDVGRRYNLRLWPQCHMSVSWKKKSSASFSPVIHLSATTPVLTKINTPPSPLPVWRGASFPGGGEATNDTPQRARARLRELLASVSSLKISIKKKGGKIWVWEAAVNTADVFRPQAAGAHLFLFWVNRKGKAWREVVV